MVTICTYNARTLASVSSIEDLLMQAGMIRYGVIGLAETRRRHPFNAVYDTEKELFLGTCDSRKVGGVGVLVNTSLSLNIDSFEQLTNRIGRLRLKRCGSIPALTIFVVYAPTSNYDEKRSTWTWRGSTEKTIHSSRSSLEISMLRSLHGLGEVLQRRPYILQGHHWRFQCQGQHRL
uniref:Endo/exonuclease/phosphatase domain-containing protein n=1 Tax=Angiostrongylus cantonensis TaxID=6313 RepID=A0A0K0D5N8_ANGCA